MRMLLLGIVSLVILMMETVIVAIGRKLGVVQRSMVISNPQHVLRGVHNIGVMG